VVEVRVEAAALGAAQRRTHRAFAYTHAGLARLGVPAAVTARAAVVFVAGDVEASAFAGHEAAGAVVGHTGASVAAGVVVAAPTPTDEHGRRKHPKSQ
jgi:hypothetical protein